MNRTLLAAGLLGLLAAGLVLFVVLTLPLLPARPATHFDFSGQPNGWMDRNTHLWVTLAIGLLVPSLVVALFYLLRRLPHGLINLPHKNYWLADEQLLGTHDFLLRQSFWMASLLVLFAAGSHGMVLRANRQDSVHLPESLPLFITAGFTVCVLLWVGHLLWHFSRVPRSGRANGPS